jgi:cell division protein FtsB
VDDRSAPPLPAPPRRTPPGDAGSGDSQTPTDGIDLAGLTVAGFTRRRMSLAIAALVAAWVLIVFARQVSEATSASARAEQIGTDNKALAAEVASLEHELQLIERPEYISQQARAYGVGAPGEVPFTLDPKIGAPGPNAPGSAALRVGATAERASPLDSWLSMLFGPSN